MPGVDREVQMKLDTMDVKILRMLQENSRIPVSEIAARLRVSRPTIKNRIEKLVKEGVISRFTVEISKDTLDNPVSVYLRLRTDEEGMSKISAMPEVVEMHLVTGRLNVLAKALIKDIGELSE
ncbi:MAG: Lrp/AsnC family transcriptional regulator, partial [Euryarchaeota archaeon]|nr:Lrp/AsnC family transcriptional regulator [Euryarchaeota archaeon]